MTEHDGGPDHNQSSFVKKRVDHDPALLTPTTTSKRQRSIVYHEEKPQQAPQTRRMINGIDGRRCVGFVGSLIRSPRSSMPNLSPTTATAALAVAASLSSPPKLVEREESSSSSSSSVGSSARSNDSLSSSMATNNDSVDIDSSACNSFSRSFSLQSAEPEKSEWVYLVEGEDVDENQLGHRMAYLQMRGFDKSLMDMMDECIYEEEWSAENDSGEDGEVDVEGSRSSLIGEDKSFYSPCDPVLAQPAIVTPERL